VFQACREVSADRWRDCSEDVDWLRAKAFAEQNHPALNIRILQELVANGDQFLQVEL
jgi:hypothetical protein